MKLIHIQLSSVTDSLVIKVHDTINAYYRGLRRITGFSKWFAGYNFRDHNRNVSLDTSMDEQLRRNIDSILEATPSNIHNPQSLVSHTSCHIWALQAWWGNKTRPWYRSSLWKRTWTHHQCNMERKKQNGHSVIWSTADTRYATTGERQSWHNRSFIKTRNTMVTAKVTDW